MVVLIDDEPLKLAPHELDEDVRRRYFRRCRFKGGGSTTVNNTSTYTPSEYELELQKAQADYANAIAPNSLWLNDTARNILQDSIGAVQVDFNGLNNQAQNQIKNATNSMSVLTGSNTAANTAANNVLNGLGNQYTNAANTANNQLGSIGGQYTTAANGTNSQLANLANGTLPSQYQQNMQNAIASALKGTMGQALNSLGQRGVLNSSVTNSAMNDISKNAADSVAQQYQSNIGLLGNLANQQLSNTNTALGQNANIASQKLSNTNTALGQQGELANTIRSNTLGTNNQNAGIYNNLISTATNPIAAAGAAQEAAQSPATNLWNASLGLNQSTTGALAAAAGKGTTTSSSTQSGGGGGFFSGLLGGLF